MACGGEGCPASTKRGSGGKRTAGTKHRPAEPRAAATRPWGEAPLPRAPPGCARAATSRALPCRSGSTSPAARWGRSGWGQAPGRDEAEQRAPKNAEAPPPRSTSRQRNHRADGRRPTRAALRSRWLGLQGERDAGATGGRPLERKALAALPPEAAETRARTAWPLRRAAARSPRPVPFPLADRLQKAERVPRSSGPPPSVSARPPRWVVLAQRAVQGGGPARRRRGQLVEELAG